jgi:hypothetical protein
MIIFLLTQAAAKPTATAITLAVSGSATYPTDYSITGPIIFSSPTAAIATIPANATSIALQVVTVGDSLVETTELITLAVASVNGQAITSPILISATITDDDLVRNRIVFNANVTTPVFGTGNAEDIYVSSGMSETVDAGAGNDAITAGFTAVGSGPLIANATANDFYNLSGGGGDDVVKGALGLNLLAGTGDASAGAGEHDILIGDINAVNYFTLSGTTAWYIAQGGVDYVSILNFNPDTDIIALFGTDGDYVTRFNANLTYLYYLDIDGGSDLIAKIDSNQRLLPSDSCFSYTAAA